MTTKNAKFQRLTAYLVTLENHLGVTMQVLETPDYDKSITRVDLVALSTTGVTIGQTSVTLRDNPDDDVLFGVRAGLFNSHEASRTVDDVTKLLQK